MKLRRCPVFGFGRGFDNDHLLFNIQRYQIIPQKGTKTCDGFSVCRVCSTFRICICAELKSTVDKRKTIMLCSLNIPE
ncbi:hypothetical protein MA16_Dca001669 [Dendrobium catenatum]|uniref:Uncharacterized protein n=1 Tax=Dendrobium catenatum TaxID=906689 RepID=A0A2I0WN33_9ASPA|nr:hypothetical protein MA16_Dca001669 [Dendrobium catenatum]